MKRWLQGFFVFVAALVSGYCTAQLDVPEFLLAPEIAFSTLDSPSVTNPSIATILREPTQEPTVETFTDASRVGRNRKNKVEVTCVFGERASYAEIRFYSRAADGRWVEKQSFTFEKDSLAGCDPEVKDFNNDGLRDFTYVSATAARGANEIRTLFLYDKKKDALVRIKDSENYPNLAYNKKLNCLDAWQFHGATTTVFLRIVGDELEEIASVDTGSELVVNLLGKYGRQEISRKKMNLDDVYTRYSTFNPPRP